MSAADSSILEVRNVSHAYGENVVLTDVSFCLNAGEILCILGPNGCGKTTLLYLIAGHLSAHRGTILLSGEDAASIPPHRRNLGFIFQDDSALLTSRSVRQNVEFPFTHGGRNAGPGRDWRQAVNDMLADTGLTPYQNKPIHELSGGMRRRVAIARSLVYAPALVLLDEPMSALDNIKKRELIPMLLNLRHKTNAAFLYITHDDREVREIADRAIVMKSGIIEQHGKIDDLLKNPKPTTKALFNSSNTSP